MRHQRHVSTDEDYLYLPEENEETDHRTTSDAGKAHGEVSGVPALSAPTQKHFAASIGGDTMSRELSIKEKRRRIAATEAYERLLVSGPPPGTKCALCEKDVVDVIPASDRGAMGRALHGLGGLMVVRITAVSNVWIHDQCARWSPEVYDPQYVLLLLLTRV